MTTMGDNGRQHDRPPAEQGDDRDDSGHFLPGHRVGAATRYRAGVSGNPAGRPPFGASVREHINIMANWTRRQLQAVIDDDDAPSAQVAAARQVLDARNGDGKAFDRCADRTEGRPTQRHEVLADPTPQNVITEANALLAELGYPTRMIDERIAAADE